MVAMRWGMRLIGLVSTIILARLLTPADFGIVAMAMVVVGLLEIIAFTGVDLALIRDGNASRADYDTAWTIQIIQGLLIAGLLLLVAPLAGDYFAEPRVVLVIQLLGLLALFDGLQNIGVVAFRKDLDFAKDFRFNIYKKLINFGIIVGAALAFRNYWALVLGMISARAIGMLLSYKMQDYRPRLSLARVRAIWSFSQWLLVSRIGFFLNRKTDQFVVGGMAGTSAMGGYHVAKEIASSPSLELVMPLRRALFPTLSKVLDDPPAFRQAMLQTFAVVALLCSALGFGLMAVADLAVPLLLGDKWLETIPLMRWLAVLGVFTGLTAVLEVALWVQGKTHLAALQTWLELAVLVPVLIIATGSYGIEGAAVGRTAVAVAFVPLMFYLTARVCPLGQGDLYRAVWRPLLAGGGMAAALWWLPGAGVALPVALLLLLKVVLGALIFAASLLLLWLIAGRPPGIEASALRQLGARLPKLNAKA